jgi:hypothetical protein
MKTLWRKNQENSSDRISHAWAPLNNNIFCKKCRQAGPASEQRQFTKMLLNERHLYLLSHADGLAVHQQAQQVPSKNVKPLRTPLLLLYNVQQEISNEFACMRRKCTMKNRFLIQK